jgi:predicted TIM-barrel fold metal-dependent hydrolase
MSTAETIVETPSGAPEVAVQMVDCDIHPYPGPATRHLLVESTPEPWRSRFFEPGAKTTRHGNSIIWDPPEYAETKSKRKNTLPPDGGPACSDPAFASKQLFYQLGVDIGVLQPLYNAEVSPDADLARCMGLTGWLAEAWLSSAPNWHGRWRGSICGTWWNPEGTAREIDRWAGHPMMVQVLIPPEIRIGMGDPRHDPIFEAACRNSIPIACHIGRGPDDRLPLPPYGPGSWYLDTFSSLIPLNVIAHLTSLVFDGAFERHPELRIAMVETGWSFVLPVLWRMDAYWRVLRHDLPQVKRPPSEYIFDHVKFSTQPIDDPDVSDMVQYIEWMEGDRLLMFSTDYPHWSGDEPEYAIPRIPKQMRSRVMYENAIDFYSLPRTVPALRPIDD